MITFAVRSCGSGYGTPDACGPRLFPPSRLLRARGRLLLRAGRDIARTLTLECGTTYRGFVDGSIVIEGGESIDAEEGVGLYASSIGDGPAGLRFHSISVSDD